MGWWINSRSLYIANHIPKYFVKPDQAIKRVNGPVEEMKCASSQK